MLEVHGSATIVDLARRHFDKQLATGLAQHYGPRDADRHNHNANAMWLSSLDTRTGRYPEPDERPPHIPKRVYRYIDAPRGCSLYWDQPQIVAAYALSQLTGDPRYADAANHYTRQYLDRAVARTGLILWGNHYYYDAFDAAMVRFPGSNPPVPVDFDTETGELHEMRPIMPAWDTMYRLDPQTTKTAIIAAAHAHLADPDTGLFNRHADRKEGCAFLEAGGILVETLAWLHAKTADPAPSPALLEPARKIAQYSFSFREPRTGLIANNPTVTRWDRHTATTEIGLWAGCLLRAADMIDDDQTRGELVRMADDAMRCYLRFAYDADAEHFYGRLHIADGTPIFGPTKTLYEPGDHTHLWRAQFPAHDYPMPLAEAALALHRRTGEPIYELTCQRMAKLIRRELPARPSAQQQGGYAEHYGRCLHFALGCAATFGDAGFTDLAQGLADEAIDVLWAHDMFRTHGGEDRYDAVDAPGYLMLALLWLETGDEPGHHGLSW